MKPEIWIGIDGVVSNYKLHYGQKFRDMPSVELVGSVYLAATQNT
tara:strand:- start:1037 stop:1171 length:135 start_codon:yes stop_codon:yes gene_type:complete